MVVIGVTGGVGTGKSTVAKMFRDLGAVVLDADELAHEAMEPKRLVWRRIIEQFGEGILNDDQTINRAALAKVVFADPDARRRLEAIVHPQVLRRIKQQLHQLKRRRGLRAVVLDVPLLIEVGAQRLVDRVVVVTAPADVQRRRLQRKYDWTEEEIARRIGSQWDVSAKAALADDIVDNADGLEHTRKQVRRLWKEAVEVSR
jgi:dephospho-CoA kinase